MLQQTRQLILEVCLIMKQIEDLQGKDPGGSLWYFIQRFKANVLFQQSQFIVNPVDILRHIEEDPEASRLYLREQELLREGPQALGDSRLDQVSLEMDKNPHLKPLKDRRSMRGVNKEDLQPLKHIAHATTSNDVSIITIDWIQYHDIFVVVGYNITSSKIVFLNYTKECKAAQVEKWVNSHLKVSPEKLRSTLRSPTVFNELRPLVAMIADTCNEGDLLVFCPSQLLNAVPLHALPYNQTEDTPIIYYHPIVYAPSNAILKDCVQRALSPRPRVQFHASLFGRYGNSRPAEELAITKTIDEIASLMSSSNASVKTILGKDVTHGAFSSNLTGADILHFQGHVSSPEIKQFLVLEPDEASSSGSFTLQDIFATGLDASLAVLMGCGSGSQIINRGDDAMGLISAFFAAGVTSVIGTLWPLDNADAVNFSRSFYKYILEKKAGQETDLVNLAAAMRAAVLDIRACQRVKCKEKRDLKARLKCHINETNAPYHWAQFSLWGSWVCRGLGVDGSGNLSVSWSFSKPADVTTAQPEPEPEPEPAKPKVQSPKAKKGFFDKLRGRWPS
jgi:CHAT domain-containing protein